MNPLDRLARRMRSGLSFVGVDTGRVGGVARNLGWFLRDLRRYRAQHRASAGEFPVRRVYPFLDDREASAGVASGDYFHQDLVVAQWIHEARPPRHVDVASRVDGFVAHVASFMPVEVFDIRPLQTSAANLTFRQADITGDVSALAGTVPSLSCLHSLEHFGLGRYGDAVDYYGYRRGWDNLYALLEPGGRFYFSVPVGPQRTEFNGQRVFAPQTLLELIAGRYAIERFAYVDDRGELVRHLDPSDPAIARGSGCAIFALRRI